MLDDKQIKKIRKTFNGKNQRIIFKILSNTNRYRIFYMLGTNPNLIVSDIAKILSVSIPLASQHLKILEQGDMLQKEKKVKKFFTNLRPTTKLPNPLPKKLYNLVSNNFMSHQRLTISKEQVTILARELFKIRISSSNEGRSEDDGVHKMEVKGIGFYNQVVIEKWYKEALKTAEIIISLEQNYLNNL